MFPDELTRNDSVPPSVNAMVSAAGKKMPVLVSPVVVIDGAAAVPPGAVMPLDPSRTIVIT
jgi:hypothetical protein